MLRLFGNVVIMLGIGELHADHVVRPGNLDDFEPKVIVVKHAKPAAVAALLDGAYNGPPDAPQKRLARIRVFADQMTNALLIRASPADLVTIRKIVREVDVTSELSGRPSGRLIGPLKHAKAVEVAVLVPRLHQAIREVSVLFGADPRTAGLAPSVLLVRSDVGLAIGADVRTNTLIVFCGRNQDAFVDSLIDRVIANLRDR
jgi:Bacterial type II/III secretion system short domain